MAKYYDKKEIYTKALKAYTCSKVFIDFIDDTELFPLEIRLKKVKQSDLQSDFSTLSNELNLLKKENLELLYREFHFKSLGTQNLPTAVVFRDRENFLNFIKKSREFKDFKEDYGLIVEKFTMLKEFLHKNPFLVVEYHNIWNKLLAVCEFFIQNPRANIYVRELGIKDIDTKFIQMYQKILDKLLTILLDENDVDRSITKLTNYGFEKKYYLKYPLPTIRFRILDSKQTIAGLSDISLNIQEFKNLSPECSVVYIVENKITTLSFPPLKNSMVIFGYGYGVEVLKDVEWLKDRSIFYWGDIDSDGFAILSQVRSYFNNTRSILMDKETLESFRHFGVQTDISISRELKNLLPDEYEMFKKIKTFRLEQEKIDFNYVKRTLHNINLNQKTL